jgi:hypothetical protein
MPKRTRSHELEDCSRNRLHRLFEEVGWTVEDLSKDYGEDLLVRIFEGGETTPLSFFVQAKATDNLFRYLDSNSNSYRYPLSHAHLAHWEGLHEPVILTIWNSSSDITYWICIQDELAQLGGLVELTKGKTVRIPIPCENVLNAQSVTQIQSISRVRYRRLESEIAGSRVLVEFLESELGVKAEYSSDGIFLIERSDGQLHGKVFGRVYDQLDQIGEIFNTSQQSALDLALEGFFNVFKKYEKTGRFPVRNPITKEVEYKQMTPEQLRHHLMTHLQR